jgi:hypothetical protein
MRTFVQIIFSFVVVAGILGAMALAGAIEGGF